MKKAVSILLCVCTVLSVLMLSACGHECTLAEGWRNDTSSHWHVCTDPDCDKQAGLANHTWDKGEITTAELKEIALTTYGIKLNSAYHAGAISSRAGMEDSNTFKVSAFSFGDVGLVAFPGEQFDTNGKFIKENSPFAMTIIATKANGEKGYFPSVTTFDYGSYECDTTRYVRGTAERLADQYVEMLEGQFGNR